ncbi:MAG: hypothetical protein IPL50_12660 [Chitinophagaceae bacterium]|nr:hypothetical protein [Chitinophagaceae bacterium]
MCNVYNNCHHHHYGIAGGHHQLCRIAVLLQCRYRFGYPYRYGWRCVQFWRRIVYQCSHRRCNLGTSTPGTYTVTYTIAAGSGCPVVTATTSITITNLPAATISYAGSPYCQNAGTATVTRTGAAGGVYSSTAGLSINAATGDVTLGTSTPGTYTVTYTMAAGGGCPVVTATATIIVSALSVAPTAANNTNGNCYPCRQYHYLVQKRNCGSRCKQFNACCSCR